MGKWNCLMIMFTIIALQMMLESYCPISFFRLLSWQWKVLVANFLFSNQVSWQVYQCYEHANISPFFMRIVLGTNNYWYRSFAVTWHWISFCSRSRRQKQHVSSTRKGLNAAYYFFVDTIIVFIIFPVSHLHLRVFLSLFFLNLS